MQKLKEKWFDIVIVLAGIAGVILIDNRNFKIICGVVVIFCIYDIFSKPVKEKEKEENPELLTDEEMEDILLDDGEFSYDNYDEVCCPDCGAYLGKDVKTCDACGYGKQKFEEVCPNCQKPNDDDMEFCVYCNHKLKPNKIEYTKVRLSDLEENEQE